MARNKTKEQASEELFGDLNFRINSPKVDGSETVGRPAVKKINDPAPLATRSKHVQLLMYPQLHEKALAEAKKQRKSFNKYIEDLLAKELGEDVSTY